MLFDLVQGDVLITINYSLMSSSIYGKMFWCECACVDDLQYCFVVTLDLKCLYLLIEKPGDENFVLAGSGLEIEFCFLCHALRVLEDIHLICYFSFDL